MENGLKIIIFYRNKTLENDGSTKEEFAICRVILKITTKRHLLRLVLWITLVSYAGKLPPIFYITVIEP